MPNNMHRFLTVLLLSVACVLGASPAQAGANATVTVDGVTRTLSQTGFLYVTLAGVGLFAPPGGSVDYSFQYSLSVDDDGLSAPFSDAFVACTPTRPATCEPGYTGFEIARVVLYVTGDPSRGVSNQVALLETSGDSFADGLTRSGTIDIRFGNFGLTPAGGVYQVSAGLWVTAIPEPAIVAQMLAGLALLAAVVAVRARRW